MGVKNQFKYLAFDCNDWIRIHNKNNDFDDVTQLI